MFAHQARSIQTSAFGSLDVSEVPDELDVAKFDLTLNVEERSGELEATLQYDSDLFDRSTAERIAERYSVLLLDALARPDARVTNLRLVPDGERRQLAE